MDEKINSEELIVEDIIDSTNVDQDLEKKVEILEAIHLRDKQRIDELSVLVDRMQSDFDNYRKRTNEAAKNMQNDGIFEVISKVLPTMDVISKAITMIQDEKISEGIRMIHQQLDETLKGFGLEEIDALGQMFDPNLHNAVMQSRSKDPDKSGMVVEILEKGYTINGKVIRHASVKVVK